MGLTAETRAPLIAPPARGIIDPNTGKPVGLTMEEEIPAMARETPMKMARGR